MMNSKLILGTEKIKPKMSWLEYIFTHYIPSVFQSFSINFGIWSDLMTDNYSGYILMDDDDPFTECREWFWTSLGDCEIYPKDFLEMLMQMASDVESGRVKAIPLEKIKELIDIDADIEASGLSMSVNLKETSE